MHLPENLLARLTKEYRFAVDQMAATSDISQKIYYFSVFHGEAHRILNWEWDTRLSLVHMVMQQTYNALITRVQGGAGAPTRIGTIVERIEEATAVLVNAIEANDDEQIVDTLARMSELAYATGGNGTYLVEKGSLKL